MTIDTEKIMTKKIGPDSKIKFADSYPAASNFEVESPVSSSIFVSKKAIKHPMAMVSRNSNYSVSKSPVLIVFSIKSSETISWMATMIM